MGKKVFISHATVDSELVAVVIEFLNNVGINSDDIFCTSISGALEGGRNFVEQIKDNVQDSRVVIFLLSERFFLSYFCLAELGAAWALNQNILPIIVPPISTAEYNNTPLIGIQALSMGNVNFANELFNDLVRKNVIESSSVTDKSRILTELNAKIKAETSILRKDPKGFYVVRLTESHARQARQNIPTIQSPVDQFLFGTRSNTLIQKETLWRLNGLLDIELDSSITEHWIAVKAIQLSSTKLQFELGQLIEQSGSGKLFSIKSFYELP